MNRSRNNGEHTVLVDMDGVIADFEQPNNQIIRTNFPETLVIPDRTDFYYADTYAGNADIIQKIHEENRKPGFFLTFPVVEGALAGIMKIREAGYHPRICTSPLENHPTVIQEKIEWMEANLVPTLGKSIVDEAIFDRDKSGYDAFALIDDRPTVRNSSKASWSHIIFSRSYNMQVTTKLRLENWNDSRLEDLLKRAYDSYRRTNKS